MRLEELGIKGNKLEKLNSRKIYSAESLLYSKPRKYYYFDKTYPLQFDENIKAMMYDGEFVAFEGECIQVASEYKVEKKISLLKVRIKDKYTHNILYINFIGMYNLKNYLDICLQKNVIVGGKLQYNEQYRTFSMLNPVVFSLDIKKYKKIIPIYSKFKGISEEMYLRYVKESFSTEINEIVPNQIIKKYNLPTFIEGARYLHYPNSKQDIDNGTKRAVFQDLLYFCCIQEYNRLKSNPVSDYKFTNREKTDLMISQLPFALTSGQKAAIDEIINTASNGERISAMIQGDVGSGKTIVAFSLMFAAVENGYQAVLMAPTTVLAKQHYEELALMAKRYGYNTALLTGETKGKELKFIVENIKNGKINFVVGTHKCISKSIEYKNLAISIVDEEHKFGVMQRNSLVEKSIQGVHSVSMSGTPIPRTLATALYGDSIKVYKLNLPSSRKPIQTAICNSDKPVFNWMEKEISNGHQCYVVCPLIAEASKDSKLYGIISIDETKKKYDSYFGPKGYKTAVITGKTSKEEQTKIMEAFKNNQIQILIATTVIEVGVNNPNATVMVISGAERFGLATLHQLRGRVGRGSFQSYCILQRSPNTEKGSNLEIMCQEIDGLEIAKEDLKNRKSGDLIGEEQSGQNNFVDLLISYPNMYNKIKEIAKYMISNNIEKDFISKYEQCFLVN